MEMELSRMLPSPGTRTGLLVQQQQSVVDTDPECLSHRVQLNFLHANHIEQLVNDYGSTDPSDVPTAATATTTSTTTAATTTTTDTTTTTSPSGKTSPDSGTTAMNIFLDHLLSIGERINDADAVDGYDALWGVNRVATSSIGQELLDLSLDEDSSADSCGHESGYLSVVDLNSSYNGNSNSNSNGQLSPVIGDTPKCYCIKLSSTRARHLGRAAGQEKLLEDEAIPDYSSTFMLLASNVIETKYITTVFELTADGLAALIDDVLNEFDYWFDDERNLMGVACEVHWSVPENHRQHQAERRMKDAVHCSLRNNNRRILNMKNNIGVHLPLTLISAVTEENCSRNAKLNCFQGVYRRFYEPLLMFGSKEASEWHKPYWNLMNTDRNGKPVIPKPEQFIFGDRSATQFHRDSLIAINVIALKIIL